MERGTCVICLEKRLLSHKCICGEASYICKQCQKKSIIFKLRPNINPSVFPEEEEGEELDEEEQKICMDGMFDSIYDDSVPGDELYTKNCGIACPVCKKRNVQCMLQELMDITFASVVGDYNPKWVLSKMFVNVEKSRKIIKFLLKNWVKNMNYHTMAAFSLRLAGEWTDNTAKNIEIGITNINNIINAIAKKRKNQFITMIHKYLPTTNEPTTNDQRYLPTSYTLSEKSQIIEQFRQRPYWYFLKFPDKNESHFRKKKELYSLLEKERSFHKQMNFHVVTQYI
jgi:hypothetical protein